MLADVARRVAAALRERGIKPSLVTILVGDHDASAGYIRIKQRQAAELGFDSPHRHLPADATQDDLLDVIAGCNTDQRPTWPYDEKWFIPGVTLDRVLVDRRVAVRAMSTCRLPGGDHRAVYARLVLPRGAPTT